MLISTRSGGRAALVLLVGSLLACTSNPPKELGNALPDAPSPAVVQTSPQAHVGETVRWGGEILQVRNALGHTEVEVFARPLMDNAEPKPDGGEGVRFIARFERFVDPAEYRANKRLTVRGPLLPAMTREVGEYPYTYPVVAVEGSHLWPVYQSPPLPADWVDPYYDPWWPWGPWGPYRYRPYGW